MSRLVLISTKGMLDLVHDRSVLASVVTSVVFDVLASVFAGVVISAARDLVLDCLAG